MKPDKITTHLTVLNYDTYQPQRNTSETQVKHKRNTSETQVNLNNNVNKAKNVNKDNNIYKPFVTDFFNYQMQQFPNRIKSITDSMIENSIDIIDKLVRLDGHDFEFIQKVMKFAVNDEFWRNQILSFSGLRNKSKNGSSKFINLVVSYEKSDNINDIAEHNKKTMEAWVANG